MWHMGELVHGRDVVIEVIALARKSPLRARDRRATGAFDEHAQSGLHVLRFGLASDRARNSKQRRVPARDAFFVRDKYLEFRRASSIKSSRRARIICKAEIGREEVGDDDEDGERAWSAWLRSRSGK